MKKKNVKKEKTKELVKSLRNLAESYQRFTRWVICRDKGVSVEGKDYLDEIDAYEFRVQKFINDLNEEK
jgi:hypothetical protein